MNDFDAMIEKYSKELIDARRKSMLSEVELEDVFATQQFEKASVPTFSDVVQPADDVTIDEDLQNVSAPNIDMLYDEDSFTNAQSDSVMTTDESLANVSKEIKAVAQSAESVGQNEKRKPVNTNSDITEKPYPLDGEGKLKVQVFAANQTYPIASAAITVRGSNDGDIFFQGFTDSSGIVDDIVLPTVSKEMSSSPSVMAPYAQYDVLVEHPRFVTRRYVGVPVFDGQKSIQTVQLVPTDMSSQKPDVVIESEPNELLLKKEEV